MNNQKLIIKQSICAISLLIGFSSGMYSQDYVAVAQKAGNSLSGFINTRGEFILPPIYSYAYGFDEEGLAPIYNNMRNEILYINLKGDTVLQSNERYELLKPDGLMSVRRISEGTLPVKLKDKFGILDIHNNEIVVALKYDEITSVSEGCAIGKIDANYYVLNTKGQEILIDYPNIKEVDIFLEGKARFELSNGKKGFIGKDGTIAIAPQFTEAYFFNDNCAVVSDSIGMYGVIDTTGNWMIEPNFHQITPFDEHSSFTIAIDRFHRNVILSMSGEVNMLENSKYTSVFRFSEGLAKVSVQLDSKKDKEEKRRNTGYIDTSGNLVISPDFDDAKEFWNGLAVVRVGYLLGVIDTVGLWVIKPQFTQMGNFTKVKSMDSDKQNNMAPEFESYDIVKYISIINNLEYSNVASVNDKLWNDFFQQDLTFLNWLMSFRLDVNNDGLWQKASKAFRIIENGDEANKNDSEIAQKLLLTFLCGTPDYNCNSSYDEIKTFIDISEPKGGDELRLLWKAKIKN